MLWGRCFVGVVLGLLNDAAWMRMEMGVTRYRNGFM